MKVAKINDSVRLYDFPKGHINEEARVVNIYPDKSVWIANVNMPFCGTISEILTQKEFETLTRRTVEV